MKFNKTILSVAVAIVAATMAMPACAVHPTNASSERVKKTYTVNSFNAIKVSGALEVDVQQGATQSLRIDGPANVLPLLEVKVKGTTLCINYEKGVNISYRPGIKGVNVYVTVPELKGIEASGACNVDVTGTVKTKDFEAELSGASTLEMESVEADVAEFTGQGASEIEVENIVGKSFEVEVQGASTFKADTVKVGTGDITASGASTVALHTFTADKADIEASGASTIKTRRSNIGKLSRSSSGASKIKIR